MRRLSQSIGTVLAETGWVLFAFFFVAGVVLGLAMQVLPSLEFLIESTIGQLLLGGLIYALVLLLVIVPIWRRRSGKYVKRILGIHKRPGREIWWFPALMWLGYMSVTILAAVALRFIPGIDVEQPQDVGFDGISLPYEYLLAFVALVVLPPIAEELLFRGYLFGRLRERLNFWWTTAIVSVAFGLVHLQWNVGVDTAILSVFLCYLREHTGTVWASIVLHAIKNGLAYILLFIAPLS